MATRFRLTASTTAPAVSPALQSYSHNAPSTVRRQLLTSDSSALTTFAYAPDAADHLVAGDALLGQFVSDPMEAGIAFTNGNTIKFAVQCLEANAGNNVGIALWAGIYSQDGSTLRRELRAKIGEGTEMATALTNRFLSTTQGGATYTTVAGDRLVVEFSASGTPTGAGGVQGHNASIRLGGAGAGGDAPEDDTSTGTTLNGWIEFAPTISFMVYTGSGGLTIDNPTLSGTGAFATTGTGALTIDNPTLAGSGDYTAPGGGEVTGTGALAIQEPSISAAGAFATTGTGALTIDNPTISASGAFATTGSGSVTVDNPTLAANGTFATTGAGAVAIDGPALSGSGTTADPGSGSGSVSIGRPAVAGSGTFTTPGSGAVIIARPSLAGSGSVTAGGVTGSGQLVIGRPDLLASGAFVVTGSGGIAIGRPALSGQSIMATLAASSDAAYGAATGADVGVATADGSTALVGAGVGSDSEYGGGVGSEAPVGAAAGSDREG